VKQGEVFGLDGAPLINRADYISGNSSYHKVSLVIFTIVAIGYKTTAMLETSLGPTLKDAVKPLMG
jgi:hypothetical protein